MERLTERWCAGGIRIKGCSTLYPDAERKSAPMASAIARLAAYEDAMPLERAQEIAQAEKDGRLVMLTPNDPLTLEELREMGKDWVLIASLIPNYVVVTGYYVKYPDFYSDGILIGYPGHMSRYLEYAQYGKSWLAYRRKPEEGTT